MNMHTNMYWNIYMNMHLNMYANMHIRGTPVIFFFFFKAQSKKISPIFSQMAPVLGIQRLLEFVFEFEEIFTIFY